MNVTFSIFKHPLVNKRTVKFKGRNGNCRFQWLPKSMLGFKSRWPCHKEKANLKKEYPKHPIVGVGAIIIRNGRILIVKRKSEPGKGKWSVPGGLVELGETVGQAVVREVKEECGLDVEVDSLIDVVDSLTKDERGDIKYHFVILDFFVKLKGGKLKPGDDAEEVKWVPLKEVEKYDLTKTFREFLKRNMKILEKYDS